MPCLEIETSGPDHLHTGIGEVASARTGTMTGVISPFTLKTLAAAVHHCAWGRTDGANLRYHLVRLLTSPWGRLGHRMLTPKPLIGTWWEEVYD
jgi:hypothetical protein